MLIALHILCDGKGSGGGVERHIEKFLWWKGEGGGEELFALAEIHVRLIIIKIRCTNSFFFKTKVEIKHAYVGLHIFLSINMYAKFDL